MPLGHSEWYILEVTSNCTLFTLRILSFHAHTPCMYEWASSATKYVMFTMKFSVSDVYTCMARTRPYTLSVCYYVHLPEYLTWEVHHIMHFGYNRGRRIASDKLLVVSIN